jgi:threonine synthase
MARLMAYYKNPGQKLHVLVATSGDTGSAVGEAFKGVEGTRVTILYPADEVSGRQKKQLDTIGGNVQAIAVDGGKFDDCQDMVKAAFTDPDLAKTGLTSANSINIGRILPQIIYYFYAWCQLADGVEPIIFSIPSGNFGDMMGAEYAWRMGLPIAKLIVSTNENDEFPLFMTTGKYAKISPSRACLSNAMNVGHPSNLARLFCLYGGTVDKTGKVWKYPNLEKMRERIFAVSVTDDETRYAIVRAHEEHNIILEPHGAVGWRGLEVYNNICPRTNAFLSVCLETAHPAKFPEQIKELLGVDPELPDSLKAIDGRIGEPIKMAADYGELKEYLLAR